MDGTSDAPMVSIVSPVFNEEGTVLTFAERVVEVLEGAGESFEIVLVDDGSTDKSWQHIMELRGEDKRIRGISLSRQFGKESAIVAGLEVAEGDAVVIMDSDLQHPPALLPDLISRWRAGAEVVAGVKTDRTGQSIGGQVASRLFNRSFRRLTGVDLTNASDYRLLSRRAADALRSLPERTTFFRGTSTWIGFRREQVLFTVDPREGGGGTRWGLRALVRLALNGITSFTPAPLHLVTIGSAIFAVFAVMLGVQTLIHFLQGNAVTGFTTVILLLLIQGTLILLGLGIVGQYLARIHDEVKGRPRYLVARSTPPDDIFPTDPRFPTSRSGNG